MSFYAIVLFFHITGALGLFVGLGLEWLIVHNLMRVNSNSQAVQWLALFKILPPIFLSSGILILISGVYMAVEIWGFNSWIISGLVLYLFLAAFGGIIVSRKVGQIKSELETDNLSESILVRLKSSLISESLKIRILLALSIIFIMTVKPDWTVTLMVICIALLTGFLLAKILK
jgi:hypothetical protein